MESFKAVFFVYLFILIGFISKKIFKEKLDEKSLVLLSVYVFQPFLTFWGLLKKPLDLDLILSPLIFFAFGAGVIFFNTLIAKWLFEDQKERSIFIVSSVIGNTGNLGVPLGIALFGENSLPYTTIVNLANVFIVYSFGAYFYSRGNFDVKESIKNSLKLPILWFALLAIFLNLYGFKPDYYFNLFLEMGAYSGIVIQLIIFGVYLAKITIKEIEKKLILAVVVTKFIILPLIAFVSLKFMPLEKLSKKIIFMEMMMPLAVANVNLSALYRCKELVVTALVFITTLLFIPLLPIYIKLMELM
ncbi:MAG: transporter [Epsilonproteobacteria bacterium]|nr:transporter [Campylobacterota bacterium]